jgi:hypothetical protein
MSGLFSIASVRRCAPSRRARAAGTACSKNSHTCPPRPERERSRAAVRSRRRQPCTKATESDSHPALSKSTARKVAGLVTQHRVDASDERLITDVSPGQMPPNDIVGDREEAAVRAHRRSLFQGHPARTGRSGRLLRAALPLRTRLSEPVHSLTHGETLRLVLAANNLLKKGGAAGTKAFARRASAPSRIRACSRRRAAMPRQA